MYNKFSIQNKFNWDVNEVLKFSTVKNMDTTSIKKKRKNGYNVKYEVWYIYDLF